MAPKTTVVVVVVAESPPFIRTHMRNGFRASIPAAAPVAGDAGVVVGALIEVEEEEDGATACVAVFTEVTAAAGGAEEEEKEKEKEEVVATTGEVILRFGGDVADAIQWPLFAESAPL